VAPRISSRAGTAESVSATKDMYWRTLQRKLCGSKRQENHPRPLKKPLFVIPSALSVIPSVPSVILSDSEGSSNSEHTRYGGFRKDKKRDNNHRNLRRKKERKVHKEA
jgi:hypothetical protein